MKKILNEKDFEPICKMYLTDMASLSDIAKCFCCSYTTISRFLVKYGITIRTAGEQTTIFVKKNGSPNIGRFKGFTYEQIYGHEKAKQMREVRKGENNGYAKVAHKYVGANNNNWRGGIKPLSAMIRGSRKNREQIREVLRRDNYTCQLCGQIGGMLEVDHIEPFSVMFSDFINRYSFSVVDDKQTLFELSLEYYKFWDKTNLRTLCKTCNWEHWLTCKRRGK